MRKLVNSPKNRITQGTIFSGVRKSYTTEIECFGIAITARCDTARDFKAALLNFLPVIRLEDWLWYECLPRCAEKVIATAIGNLRRYLCDKDGSSIVLDAFGVAKAFEREGCADKIFISAREQFKDASNIASLLPHTWEKVPNKTVGKEVATAAREILANRNQEFFFIDDLFPEARQDSKGYVVLLREVRSLPRIDALALCGGIDNAILCRKEKGYLMSELDLHFHEIAYPVSELASPYIEQMMQSFSSLFARVGVPELDKSFVQKIDKLIEG